MDPIKNAGAVDYAMTVPQNQNQVEGYGDYSSMPMVYEPEVEQKKKASSNMLGLTAAGVLGVVVGLGIGKKWGGKGVKEAQAMADEALKKYEAVAKEKANLEKAKNEAEKALGNYREADLKTRFIRRFYPNYKLSEQEIAAKKAAREAKAEADKAAKEAKKADKKAEKAADKTEKTEKKD